MKVDKTEIVRTLEAVFAPGDVFEIRILDALTQKNMRPHTVNGYFDYEHIRQAADEIENMIRFCPGVYYTPNAVNPALLARSCNHLRDIEFRNQHTTGDTDIQERRWILIDCDAVRPAGISSSDLEHNSALDLARGIRENFRGADWPDPILIDSGNGAQLMYRTDAQSDSLFPLFLKKLDRFCSTDKVKIDVTVYNRARIWRLPGTFNQKGEPVKDRPHRLARIIDLPDKIECVTLRRLADACGIPEEKNITLPEASKTGADLRNVLGSVNLEDYHREEKTPFQIDDWIARHCPEIGHAQEWNGGRKWVFRVCPFNPEHKNASAVITEQPNGAIAFTCHHNGCAGNDWHALRDLLEPGWRKEEHSRTQKKNTPEPKIEIREQEEIEQLREIEEKEKKKPWRKISNDDLYHVLEGTFLGELVKLYASVTVPALPLEGALLKAIVTLGCALSGEGVPDNAGKTLLPPIGAQRARLRINTAGGQVCNIYALLAAESARGKDIGNLLDIVTAARGWALGTSGSAEGIAEALKKQPNGLLSISEFMNWIDEKHWQHKATSFLTEAFSKGFFRHNFSSRGGKNGVSASDYCYPSIIANIQPDVFSEIARTQDIASGFMARFLYAKMPSDFFGDPAKIDLDGALAKINAILDVFLRKHGVVDVPSGYSRTFSEMFKKESPEKLHPVWRRLVNEYMVRFAVMLSVNFSSVSQQEFVKLDSAAWEGAGKMTLWFFRQAEEMLAGIDDLPQNVREQLKIYKRLLAIIQKYDKGEGVTTKIISVMSSRTGTSAEQRKRMLSEMIEFGWISANGGVYENGTRFKIHNIPIEMR